MKGDRSQELYEIALQLVDFITVKMDEQQFSIEETMKILGLVLMIIGKLIGSIMGDGDT